MRFFEADPPGYVWGVFKGSADEPFYANKYFADRDDPYPTMVKGNLSQEEAEKLAASMSVKKESTMREVNRIVECLLEADTCPACKGTKRTDQVVCNKCAAEKLGGKSSDFTAKAVGRRYEASENNVTCTECGKPVDGDEAIWIDPKTLRASTGDNAKPYHMECAPDEY